MRILVIDDNETFCRELEELVQLRHYFAAWCTSGTHGLERALEEAFDLIIVDGRLDDGNGVAVGQRLEESLPETPLLVLSTAADKSTALYALGTVVRNLAQPPLEPRQLLDVLQQTTARIVRAAE